MKGFINLELKQSQKINMTMELKQSIKMLEMNVLELDEYISELSLENPLIEYERAKDYLSIDCYNGEFKGDYSNLFVDKEEKSLQEHIAEQLNFMDLDGKLISCVMILSNNLNESGYLKDSIENIASPFNLDIELLNEALKILNGLDPLGLGGKDLVETLLLQVEDDDILYTIIEKYLNEVAGKKFSYICKTLNITDEILKDKLDKLTSLNPKPGLKFKIDKYINYITPDAKVEVYNEIVDIIIYDDILNNINLSRFYDEYKEVDDLKTKEFIGEKKKEYNWLINSLQIRKKNLYSVINKIVELQIEYFSSPTGELKPMTQKKLASILSISESTVSRIVNNKYIETSKGILPLKYFFYSGSKDFISDKVLMDRIKAIVDNEDKSKPLSDEKIKNIMESDSFKIARRTISKYRMKLGYENASKRRILK